jgi:hypothetical protein
MGKAFGFLLKKLLLARATIVNPCPIIGTDVGIFRLNGSNKTP